MSLFPDGQPGPDPSLQRPEPASQPEGWGKRLFYRVSLRQAFVLVVVLGLLVPALFVAQINLRLRQASMVEQLKHDQDQITDILARGMRQPLWDLSTVNGRPLLDSVMKDERVVSVSVWSTISQEVFLQATAPARRLGAIQVVTSPISQGTRQIGRLTIEFDQTHLAARISNLQRDFVLLIAAQFALSVILILVVLDSRFLRPLRQLGIQAMHLSRREFKERFDWRRDDEIGDLGRYLEWTRQELLRLFDELERKNAELEVDIAERKQVEQALRSSERKYRELFVSNLDGIFVVDLAGRILDANPAVLAMLGVREDQLKGHLASEFIAPDWHELDRQMMQVTVPSRGYCNEYEIELCRSDGLLIPVSAKGVLMRDDAGGAVGIWRLVRDLTEGRDAQRSMELAAKVFENTTEAIVITDAAYRILTVNRAFSTMTGFNSDKAVGRMVTELPSGRHKLEMLEDIQHSMRARGQWQGEVWLRRANGEEFPCWAIVNDAKDRHGRTSQYIALISDISERKRSDERIQYLAHFDVLTGLPNRGHFQELVNQALALADRNEGRCALLFIDLDRFKTINDSLGHVTGDELLKAVADRLKQALRAGDNVGRLGGDEFVIVLSRIDSPDEAATVAQRVLERLSVPFLLSGHDLIVTPSIGIGIYPEDGEDYDTLVKNADAAMYHAKESGRNNFQFYTSDMNARAYEILAVESQLRRAIEREEFVLHYQPQVDMRTGRIVGAEALIRWQHPENGLVGPGKFIPIAEERGLIVAIGNWVLREAARQNRAWQDAGLPPIAIAVNLSALQFYRQDICGYIAGVLADTGLEARYLELEVTESIIMQDVVSTVATMDALKSMGLKLAIDDFGTGYSSLNYLKRFKADKLKVDRSFVSDVPGDPDDCAITRAIINLARNLNLKVIAEGVETVEQWQFLLHEHCDEVQGYLVCKPQPPADMAQLLKAGLPIPKP